MLLCFLLSLLAWADAGNSVGPLQVIDLLQGTLTASIPLVLGALAGLLGERSGVINIAIEGQLLTGAFVAAAVASVTGGVWLGLSAGRWPAAWWGRCSRYSRSCSWWIRSSWAWCST